MPIQGILSKLGHGSHAAPTTIVDYTEYVRAGDFDEQLEEEEATVWGTTGVRDYEAGFNSGTLEVRYKYVKAIYNVLRDIKENRTAVNYEYAIQGDDTGEPSTTGAMVLTRLSRPNAAGGGLLEVSATWRLKSITEGDFA